MTPEQHSTSSSGWGDMTSNDVADVISIIASGVVNLRGPADGLVPSVASLDGGTVLRGG
jgi:hypothetical protein